MSELAKRLKWSQACVDLYCRTDGGRGGTDHQDEDCFAKNGQYEIYRLIIQLSSLVETKSCCVSWSMMRVCNEVGILAPNPPHLPQINKIMIESNMATISLFQKNNRLYWALPVLPLGEIWVKYSPGRLPGACWGLKEASGWGTIARREHTFYFLYINLTLCKFQTCVQWTSCIHGGYEPQPDMNTWDLIWCLLK